MPFVARLYEYVRTRRPGVRAALLMALGSLLVIVVLNLRTLQVEENISAMLPDGDSGVARNFALLQKAPFARKVVIQLQLRPATDRQSDSEDVLLSATTALREQLPESLFRNPISGPAQLDAAGMVRAIGDYLPRLATADDLAQIEARLKPERIDVYLQRGLEQLLLPQGVVLKRQIQRDPLQLDELAQSKLRHLNPIPHTRVRQGHFVSASGNSTLILADTPIEITDAAGSRDLMQAFRNASALLPPEVEAELISAHAYTLANAEVIQADVKRVLTYSALGILLVFALVLRSLRAFAVYLIPLLAMLGAVQITALWFDALSGITIGFGAVLLGITIDAALHVYFALQQAGGSVAQRLQAVARPVSFGAFTTMAAFGVLLGSDLPGQRQLAVFAISGIAIALLLALVLLPHLTEPGFAPAVESGRDSPPRWLMRWFAYPRRRAGVAGIWLMLIMAGMWFIQDLHVNGSLRQLSYTPPQLHKAEQELAQNWGNMRGRALIFATAPELEQALVRNEEVWKRLQEQNLTSQAVSIAPILSSAQTQAARLLHWKEFWDTHNPAAATHIRQSAAAHGFAPWAFAPFWERTKEDVPVLEPERLRAWGLGQMLDALLVYPGAQGDSTDGKYRVLTLVPDTPEVIEPLTSSLETISGVTLVSQSRFGTQLAQAVRTDFQRFILGAGLVVVALLLLLFRRLNLVFLALIPVISGLVAMYGGMGLLGLELNMFNVVASILIIGLGVDYGIFMVCQGQERSPLASGRAIILSGITTLIGFGVLVLAQHPALYSIGITVLLGVSAAVPAAVLVIPALQGYNQAGEEP